MVVEGKQEAEGEEQTEGKGEPPQQELARLQDQMLRLQADFENARKRWRKEQAELQERASADVLRELLEIHDDFQRAVGTAGNGSVAGDTFRKGVEMIARRLEGFLKSYGIVPMEVVGKPFDPALHEAVAHEVTEEVPESTVLEELRKGYQMNGKVLRTSVVKVSKSAREKRMEIIVHNPKSCLIHERTRNWLERLESDLSKSDLVNALKEVHLLFDDYAEQLKFTLIPLSGHESKLDLRSSSLPETGVVIEHFRQAIKES